ncbi:MAG: 16S rRNA (cytosine(1402)-N(4))-methyltransferase RsmH [Gammaproteobacteria bacterium]|nr:16S rRNA (cytosine(1402)-N(4))-methyltransferase RsmH [Gammaproteobacteria bacterium]
MNLLALTSLLDGSSPSGEESQHGFQHKAVLASEVVAYLELKGDGIYVDATFGRGGHTRAILQQLGPNGRVYALDKDPAAVTAANLVKDSRLIVRQGSFTELQAWMQELELLGKVDGILLDLGVSSPQLDDPLRGFSFQKDGPLDMRMDPDSGQDAATWINNAAEEEIARVLKEYGEERFSRRIAGAIVKARAVNPFTTTLQLAAVVAKANPKWEKHKHPATRAFQAIRIFVNNELKELAECLEQCLEVLAVGGRLLTISFHSLEYRIVKQFINKHVRGGDFPSELPLREDQLAVRLKRIKGAIRPMDKEIAENSRARSAVLRVVEKLS